VNATLIQAQFKISRAKFDDALNVLKKNLPADLAEYVSNPEHSAGVHLINAFQHFGYDIVFHPYDAPGIKGIQQRNFESAETEHASVFGQLNGIVEQGSYMLFHADDDTLFRWRWGTDGLFHVEENGVVFFGERDSLLLEIRGTLQNARHFVAASEDPKLIRTGTKSYVLKQIDSVLAEMRKLHEAEDQVHGREDR
jgi:hypothetical protein